MPDLNLPGYIEESGIIGAPIQYEWDSQIELQHFGERDQNVKLYRAIDRSNYRVKYALGVAVTEWLVWRFHGHANLADIFNRLEAAWANEIHPAYSRTLRFNLTKETVFSENPRIDGPLKLITNFLGDIRAHYYNGNIYIADPIVKQVMLAKRVLPPQKAFEEWLQDRVRAAAEKFPRGTAYNRNTEKYDFFREKSVPREFFDRGFEYSESAALECFRLFLATLDPTKNRYLCSPDEMRERGFSGVPYTI
ncbi:MAG: hypothetical protein JO334_13005 [Verrucomicrobia bacterium]|nr:hypothetical protein [Verrucomicrobiota bacterium]